MEYKWKALTVVSVGAMLSSIDSTVVLLALFPIATSLHSDFVTMTWVVVAYLLVNTALVLSLGRLSDMYGRKKMFNTGFIIFTFGSALCGISLSGLSLVGFRVLQGLGAALLIANSFAILSEAFPRNETGKAFGLTSIVWSIGAIVGIILGGVIVTYSTWRLIFLINVPVGIFGTLWGYKSLRESRAPNRKETFDIPAAAAFTIGLFSILLGVTWGLLYSWSSLVTLSSIAVAPVFFAVFVAWETKYSKDPIVDFEFFRNRVFSSQIVAALLQSLALFSVNFLLIFYLEGISGLSVLSAAYLIAPLAVASAFFSPIGGILSDKFGARVICAIGLGLQLVVLLLLIGLTTSTSVLVVAIIEAIYGIGGGLFWPANTSAIMSSSPPARYGVGSGIMNTFRNSGMIMSFTLALTATTAVIPSYIVYQLFIGNLTEKLSSSLANSYLAGQSFAFEISAVLLVFAIVIVVISASTHKDLSKKAGTSTLSARESS